MPDRDKTVAGWSTNWGILPHNAWQMARTAGRRQMQAKLRVQLRDRLPLTPSVRLNADTSPTTSGQFRDAARELFDDTVAREDKKKLLARYPHPSRYNIIQPQI